MKVYIIEIDGKSDWDGNSKTIKHVSSSYRKASLWLLENGFMIRTFKHYKTKENDLKFIKNLTGMILDEERAEIIEMEVDID